MALLTYTYTKPASTTLTSQDLTNLDTAFTNFKASINSIDNTQVNPTSDSALIGLDKIANGSLVTTHASRHAINGADPLPASSVGSAQIQARCINASHIGIGSILAEHLGYTNSASGLFCIDSSLQTAAHGATITAVDGYTNFIPILAGHTIDGTANSGSHMFATYVRIYPSGATFKVDCYANFDGGKQTTGSVFYYRMAWK